MHQIPNPGDGFLPPPGTMRYVLTFEELCITGKTLQQAIEQWLLARNGSYEVRAIGAEEVPGRSGELVSEYRCRFWLVTVKTPWHVYTVSAGHDVGHWKAVEEGCRTIDRKMVETGQAVDMRKEGSPI